MKTCMRCEETKPLDAFHRSPKGGQGRDGRCRACRSAAYRANPLPAKERAARRRRDKPVEVAAAKRRWERRTWGERVGQRKACSARHNAKLSAERLAAKAAMVRPCSHCGGMIPAHRRADAITCTPQCSAAARNKRYEETHKDKRRAQVLRYRARKRAAFVADVTPAEIYDRDGWICGICGERVAEINASIDHIIPLARGGTHEPANVQLAHLRCNQSKNDRLPEEMAA